jgi:hypothetical protein
MTKRLRTGECEAVCKKIKLKMTVLSTERRQQA